MRKHLLWLLCLALPAGAQDWLALTLYPGGDLYQAAHLQQLVGATQNLWTLQDAAGRTPIRALDSLASTNAIAVQGDDVRFRRLIETRELTPAGLQTLAGLVEQHPLLGPRLVTPGHDATHFWLRLAHPYSEAEQAELKTLATELAANTSLKPEDFMAMGLDRCKELKANAAAAPVVPGSTTQAKPGDEFASYDLNALIDSTAPAKA